MQGDDAFAWCVLATMGVQLAMTTAILLHTSAASDLLASVCGV